MTMTDLMTAANSSKAWPFQEAQKLLKRYPDGAKPDGSPVLFETGYGPSISARSRKCSAPRWSAARSRR